ncbi:Photosystem I assembly protein Ycf3 [Rhynchospora pubera]|uniref:Photosystem I assembly protein Ycf3 n=1 Tax=Rhynchospora pubera TaxID=906938 RepID=A0AAV8B3K0_9POAL|nr:Photosystem I assembly protein Ycf3 [Rhynchospora pubera]
MSRSRINGNFIDRTFSIVANILLGIIPTTSGEKKAFTYYRDEYKKEYITEPYEIVNSQVRFFRKEFFYSDRGEQAILEGDSEIAEDWFNKAAEYWKQAIALTPDNYIDARNWLKITKRFKLE